jgi:LmbE family N-acetylglucosaminyl deacetylase
MDDAMTPLASRGEHLVVAVAHPDDETFGCGSLIAQAAAAGARVTVICATRGEEGERRADEASDHLPLAVVRERELRDAAAVLGVDRVEVLDYADSGWEGPFPPGALCATPVDAVADDLARLLADLAPDVVLTIDGSDGHRDHAHIRDALDHARNRPAQRWRLVRVGLANSLMRRWVDEMRARESGGPYVEIDIEQLGTPDAELTAIDVTAFFETRERAIACHRSQQSPYDALSHELRRAFLCTTYVREAPARD